MSVDKLVEVGYQQHLDWKKIATADRFKMLSVLLDQSWIAEPIRKQLDVSLKRLQTFSAARPPLKGPTGEMNQLVLESRGVVLVSDRLAIEGVWLLTSVLSLCAGNSIVCHVQPSQLASAVKFQAWLRALGWPYLFQIITVEQYQHGLNCAKITLVIFWGEQNVALQLKQILAARLGSIIPLVTVEPPFEKIWHDLQQPWFLLNLFYEKTCSINTTAVGGNTELLTAMSMHEDMM